MRNAHFKGLMTVVMVSLTFCGCRWGTISSEEFKEKYGEKAAQALSSTSVETSTTTEVTVELGPGLTVFRMWPRVRAGMARKMGEAAKHAGRIVLYPQRAIVEALDPANGMEPTSFLYQDSRVSDGRKSDDEQQWASTTFSLNDFSIAQLSKVLDRTRQLIGVDEAGVGHVVVMRKPGEGMFDCQVYADSGSGKVFFEVGPLGHIQPYSIKK